MLRRTIGVLWIVLTAVSSVGLAGESKELAHGSGASRPQQPQVAVDGAGGVHVVYGVGDVVYYVRSTDGGQSFSAPSELPSVYEMSLGMRRGPRVAAPDSSVCVTAIGGKQGRGRDGDLLAMQSTDGGKSWSKPVAVNDVADAAREGLHAMAAGPGNAICCAWLDLRNSKTEVMSSMSKDGGLTWSKNVVVYRSPDGSVCECCHPSVAFDGRGQVYVQWRNSLGGARDMYVASSLDGITFGKAAKLGTGTWPLNRCPMDGGAIAIGGQRFFTAWRRDKIVYLIAERDREERRLGPGEQPWIAATAAGPHIVWLAKRDGEALYQSPTSRTAVKLADHATDPVIAVGPAGKGPVFAAWESSHGDRSTIQIQLLAQ